jgi:hypothetical protein
MNENKCENRERTQLPSLSLSEQDGSYQAPALEVIEIKMEQHILANASGDIEPFHGSPW